MKTLCFTSAAMMIGSAAMTAHAAVPVRIMVQEPVSYHDLNLENGARRRHAADPDPVCRPQGLHPGESGPDGAEHQGSDVRSCTEAATARAIASIDAPLLTRRAISLGVIDAAGDVARTENGEVSVLVATQHVETPAMRGGMTAHRPCVRWCCSVPAGVFSTHRPGREARMRLSTCTVLLVLSCAADASDRPYTPPRLDNGQPDMQGVWIASNSTPLQRPPGFTRW